MTVYVSCLMSVHSSWASIKWLH